MRTSIGHFSSRELPCSLNGNADLKTRLARNGLDADLASQIPDDAVHNIEPKPGALADSLGGEKRVEDPGLYVCRNSRAVVGNFYEDKIVLARRADGQVPVAVHGVGGVVDQVGPDLIEFAAASHDLREIGREIDRKS